MPITGFADTRRLLAEWMEGLKKLIFAPVHPFLRKGVILQIKHDASVWLGKMQR